MTADEAASVPCGRCGGSGWSREFIVDGVMGGMRRAPLPCPKCHPPRDNTNSIPSVVVPPSPSAAPGVVPVPRNTRQDGDDTETADDGFWRRLATREDFDPYGVERGPR